MAEESDIMDQIHALDDQLRKFDPKAHWFCAKKHDDDYVDYDTPDEADDDATPKEKQKAIEEWKLRQKVAYRYAMILGLGEEISGRKAGEWAAKIKIFLTSCSNCITNWHMGRRTYLQYLSEQFGEEIASQLESLLDDVDFQRIDNSLASGQDVLAQLPPEQRTQALLADRDMPALVSLYEALCCVKYHQDDEKLAKHFDFVFEQIQSPKKILRVAGTPPAMTRFIFSRNPVREAFASQAWKKLRRNLTSEEFEWAAHGFLEQTILLVANPRADSADILLFWKGFLKMLDSMDEDIIRHCLRAMEVQPDVYRLALQHLASSSEQIIACVINSLHSLILKAPKDFWGAMGTISATTVIDQIFQSPGFAKWVNNPEAWAFSDESPVAWIPVLLNSLDSVHQFEACRKLLDSLFGKVQQNNQISSKIKQACGQAALEALHVTLQTLISTEYRINATTSLIMISNTMGLVRQFSPEIMSYANLDTQMDSNGAAAAKAIAMLVIKDALSLDCKAVSAESAMLENGKTLQRGGRADSRQIWQSVLDIFRPGKLVLVKSILPALVPLTGVDVLLPENKHVPERLPKGHYDFNKDLRELFDNTAKVLERLSDFSASDLSQLMEDNAAARTLIACLISADPGISGAAVEIIKVMTVQDSKKDAFEHLLSSHLAHTLAYMTAAIKKVVQLKNFGPVPFMIKANRDILSGLCGTTGVLRSRSTFQKEEQHAVFGWWIVMWHALDNVFSNTESWATRVDKPTKVMQDLLREFMEFAESLFDSHSIIASVESDGGSSETNAILEKAGNKKVLEVVCRNIRGLIALIRLRDEYLVSVISSLLVKLLRALGEYDLAVDDDASSYIKGACRSDPTKSTRTNLTSRQKAELRRALDDNVGIELVETSTPTNVKKQGKIDTWSQSAGGQQHEPTLPPKRALPFARSDKPLGSIKTLDKAKKLVKMKEAPDEGKMDEFKAKRKQLEADRQRVKDEAKAKAQALRNGAIIKGEGSGLQGIGGIAGKDHAPTRSEIMVGSSDEDSDDDEDEDETNALVKKQQVKSKMVTEYEESRRKAHQMAQGPVKKAKIQRSVKDQRARVDPDMTKLFVEVLSWDIFHPGDAPPGNNQCRKIDNRYLDLGLYKETFGPLLISEVWRSIVTAKDENTYKAVEIKVLNRVSVDKFLEVSTSMPMAFNKDLKMSERDIVLFSKDPNPLNNPQAPHCLARVDRTTRKKDVIEITYRIGRDVNPNILTSLVPNGKMFALKICDLTTTQREFAALSSLEYYDLCMEVLEASPSPLLKYKEDKISSMSARYSLNTGQAKAILSAVDNDGFTLIQGPPGSGKTKTIVAMVGALLTPILQQQQADQARIPPPSNGKAAPPSGPKKKLLICAPSNAAVDELVVRLMEGIQPLSGSRQKINVIRIGRSDAINTAVKSVMLDELVRTRLEGDDSDKQKMFATRDALHKDAGAVKDRLNVLRPLMEEAQKDDQADKYAAFQKEFDVLKRKQTHLGAKIDEDKESGMTISRQNEISRRKFQQEIINGAHVICATLSGSGHDMFKNLEVDFETVIIDEAAQCIELSALIPLKYGCSKCILVGDPEQLPPTVLSTSAKSFGYEQSLFVRMQKNHPKNVHLLDTQYRMHPEISRFPSAQFYNSRLLDGPGMAALRRQPWHASKLLGPYRFFDVKGVQTQQTKGHSIINVAELNAALQLYQRLKSDYQEIDFKGKIGIITTYKAQLNELKSRFARKYGDEIFEEIEFNTTDAFQGREREIIIFSCVRAKATGGIGFLNDIRRMNVGLTRAKSSLWVLGDSRALQQGPFWNKLIVDAQARNRYTSENVMELFSRPTERLQGPIEPEAPLLPQRNMSVSSAASGRKTEDGDTVMSEASDLRKSSVSSAGGNVTIVKNAPKKNLLGIQTARKPTIKQEPRSSSPATGGEGATSLGKRTRESSDDDSRQRAHPKEQKIDLDAALRAQMAARPAMPSRPARPPGVGPPRKKKVVDPFMPHQPPPKR